MQKVEELRDKITIDLALGVCQFLDSYADAAATVSTTVL